MDGGGCGNDFDCVSNNSCDDLFDANSDIDCDSCSDDDDPNATSVCNRNVDGDSGGLVASADANAEGSGDDENSVDSTSEVLRKSSLVFKYFTDSDGLGDPKADGDGCGDPDDVVRVGGDVEADADGDDDVADKEKRDDNVI